MNVKYQLDMPKKPKKWLLNNFKSVIASGYCHKNKIYLYGSTNDINFWIDIIVHENYHTILDLLNIPVDYHHEIMEFLPNIFKYRKERLIK